MSIWVVLELLHQLTNTRVLSLFTTEYGNPSIRKSMFTSFSIVCSWPVSSGFTTGCPVLSRIVSSPKLKLSWEERVWEPSGTLLVWQLTTGRPVRSCATLFSTLKLLLASDERVWVAPVSTTGCPVLSWLTASSWKERVSISENGTFFFHLARFLCQFQQRVLPFYRF